MSHRSAVRSSGHGPRPSRHDGLRAQPKLPQAAPADRTGWTLGHGGRQVRVGPVAFWIIVGSLVRDGRLVGRHRHLFRIPRRRADPPARAPGADAIRLRGPHRRSARPGRPAGEPAVARPGAVREQARPDHAPPDAARIALVGARPACPTRSPPARSSRAPRAARRAIIAPQPTPKPSPINDTVILVPPPEREARLESRTPLNSGVRACRAADPAPASKARSRGCRLSLDRFEARPGQDAQRAGRKLRRQGAPHAQHARRSRPRSSARSRRACRARASGGPFVPVNAPAMSRHSTASSIASSSRAGTSIA